MALDGLTEVTSTSWISRLMDSIKNVLIGIVLFLVAFPVLFWNEGCSVKNYQALKEGAAGSVVIDPATVAPANEGKLIFTSGQATTTENLQDQLFNISSVAIRLERKVQMYQWTEKKTTDKKQKLGGGEETTTTYSYALGWSDQPQDSSQFKEPKGHANPVLNPPALSWTAGNVTVGAFTLPGTLVNSINKAEAFPATAASLDKLPPDLKPRATVEPAGTVYIRAAAVAVESGAAAPAASTSTPADPAKPILGDVRISFFRTLPTAVSLTARQAGTTFAPFTTRQASRIPWAPLPNRASALT